MIEDIFGHIGYLLSVIGTLFITGKNRSGFLFRMAGDAIWLLIGIYLGYSSIVLWSLLFLGVDFRAYRKWVNDASSEKITGRAT